MKTVTLTGQQWLMIEASIIITLRKTTERLDEYLDFDPAWSDEMHFLAAWAELSIAQQRDALEAFRRGVRGAPGGIRTPDPSLKRREL